MLVVVKTGMSSSSSAGLLFQNTGERNIFQVYAAKSRRDCFDGTDNLIRVFVFRHDGKALTPANP